MGEWRRGGEEEWRRWFECPDLAWADCVVAVSVRGELEGDVTWSRPGTLQSGQATPGHTGSCIAVPLQGMVRYAG